ASVAKSFFVAWRGKADDEGRTLTGTGAFGADAAAVQLDDALDDGKAEAGRTLTTGRLRRQALETPEQAGHVVGGKAGPFVAHAQHRRLRLHTHRNFDSAADRTVLDRVADHVVDRFAQPVRIAHRPMAGWRHELDGLVLPPRLLAMRGHDLRQQ